MIIGKVHGVGNVARILNRNLPEVALQELKGAVKDEAEKILAIAKADAPVGNGPGWGGYPAGTLKAALQIKTSGKGLIAKIGIYRNFARGFIARFLEFGTRAHSIEPQSRKALAFAGRFASRAAVAGIAPKNWLVGATTNERGKFQERLRQAMIKALRSVSR